MSLLICIVPVCPVRSEPAHRSEQVTQLLFGETCSVLLNEGDFVKIKCSYDDYEGWCQASQLTDTSVAAAKVNSTLATEFINEVLINDQPMFIPFGSTIDSITGFNNSTNNINIEYDGERFESANTTYNESNIKNISLKFLNTAYQWGGRSVFGIDCSGFTQLVFKCMNVHLLRDASQQATQGEAIGFLQEAKAGDLAFFDNKNGTITHVGILLSADKIIHASGKVRIDTMDNMGIVNSETGKRTHQLRVIKRLVY